MKGGLPVKNFSVSDLWSGLIRAMRACTKKERLEREKEARQEAAERVSRVRNKWESISIKRAIIVTLFPYITDPCFYSSFNPRMANLKSDDWRENMKARMDQENAEKWDKYVAPKSPSFPFNLVPHHKSHAQEGSVASENLMVILTCLTTSVIAVDTDIHINSYKST